MEAKHNSDPKPSTGGNFAIFEPRMAVWRVAGGASGPGLNPAQHGCEVATATRASAGNSKCSFGAHWGPTDALRPLLDIRIGICAHCRRNFLKSRKWIFVGFWDL